MQDYSSDASWRDSAHRPKFFMFDAYATFPLLLFLFHIEIWTFALSIAIMVFFLILNHFGFTMPVFLRWVRSVFAGRRKLSQPWWM